MKHKFTSGKADLPDATLVRPSDWNDFHVMEAFTKAGLPAAGTAGRLALVADDVRGIWFDTGTEWIKLFPQVNVKDFDARGDALAAIDGAITTGTPDFTSAGAAFVAADVGKKIAVRGAGAAGAVLITTILAFVSSTAVTL